MAKILTTFMEKEWSQPRIIKIKTVGVFHMRGKSEKIESIHFAEKSGFSSLETEKEVLPPITQL